MKKTEQFNFNWQYFSLVIKDAINALSDVSLIGRSRHEAEARIAKANQMTQDAFGRPWNDDGVFAALDPTGKTRIIVLQQDLGNPLTDQMQQW